MFKIGDKIRLRDYTEYTDYKEHKGEIATIVSKHVELGLPWEIQWKDLGVSNAAATNLMRVNTDWDEETN